MIINLECISLYISSPPIQKTPRPLNLLFWCCTRWSLHQRYVTISASRLLPYFFTLTIYMAVIFCCTFLRITSTRRYLAPCLVVPGLSSHFARSSEILIFKLYHTSNVFVHSKNSLNKNIIYQREFLLTNHSFSFTFRFSHSWFATAQDVLQAL